MVKKPIEERLEEIQFQNPSRKEIVSILYLEKYPIFEITKILSIDSSELRKIDDNLKLFLLRCPVGHRLYNDPALHAEDAHYCTKCQRWFNEATLKDEIELEIERLKEKEASNKFSDFFLSTVNLCKR